MNGNRCNDKTKKKYFLGFSLGTSPFITEFENTLKEASEKWSKVKERNRVSKGESKFRARLIELEKARSEYLNLSIIREQKLKSLRSEKRARQLEEYLNKYFIADAQIASIGPSRKSTLQSYGIETAKDVSRDSLLSIQGFGPALTNNLVAWRDSIECEFVFDSNKGMPQSLINEIDREVYHQRLDLESRLTNGKKQLEEITNEIYWNTGSCRQR